MTVITEKFNKDFLDNFVYSIENLPDKNYYVFIGRNIDWSNEPNVDEEKNNLETLVELHSNILFGKKVTTNDYCFMIKKISWTNGEIYDHYDNTIDMKNKKFYVVNSSNDVFKCLYNNNDAPSTIEPTSKILTPFELSDGYVWKYLYSIPSEKNTKFSDTSFMPVLKDDNVSNNAIKGTIDFIKIFDGGNYYEQKEGIIQEVVNTKKFRLENSLPDDIDRYKNLGLYIKSGTGAGSLTTILSYEVTPEGKYITVEDSLNLDTTSEYLISPKVDIKGDGQDAKAYSVVSEGKINKINIINSGHDYKHVDVSIISNPSYGSGGDVKGILSPLNGHGYDPITELFSDNLKVVVDFNGTEGGKIPEDIDFRQHGLILNPLAKGTSNLYTNDIFNQIITLSLSNINNTFQNKEKIQNMTTGATANIIKVDGNDIMITNINGDFDVNNDILGETSGATALVSSINTPDLEFYSGDVLFFTNTPKIQRVQNSKETISLILKV